MNPSIIATLETAFSNSASPDAQVRKNGENYLENLSKHAEFGLMLINLMENSGSKYELQLRAAIQLKNWTSKLKRESDYSLSYLNEVIPTLQVKILEILPKFDKKVSLIISKTIHNLATIYFPKKWQELPLVLANNLVSGNYQLTWISLKTLTSITEKYEYSSRSDPLYEEIIVVCDSIHDALKNLTMNTLTNLNTPSTELFQILKLSLKLFYHLNYQDLHPKFEDNLNQWMEVLRGVLSLKMNLADDLPLFKCKGEAMKSILLYATKYREDVESLIQSFSQEIWNVCVNTSSDPKYEKMILNALKYFKNLVTWSNMRPFFSSNMSSLFNSLLIPQSRLTSIDAQNFQDEPQTLIDNYFENSEINTKRSINSELLKTICRTYSDEATEILKNYIMEYVTALEAGGQDLEKEIIICNLIVDGLTVAFRPIDGVTQVSLSEDLITFTYSNIVKNSLAKFSQNMNSVQPLHASFLFRYIFFFRNFIPHGDLQGLLTFLAPFLKINEEYLQLACAYTLEGLLNTKVGDFKSFLGKSENFFNKSNCIEAIKPALSNVILLLQSHGLQFRYMKLIGNIISLIEENAALYCDDLLIVFENLFKQLISQGYTFSNAFMVFDGYANIVAFSLKGDKRLLSKIDEKMVFLLQSTMQKNIQEMLAFVVQLFAVVVEFAGETNGQSISSIFNSIICAENWIADNEAIIPAYLTFLQAYFKVNANSIATNNQKLGLIFSTLLKNNQSSNFSKLAIAINFGIQSFPQLNSLGLLPIILQEMFNKYQALIQEKNSFEKISFVKDSTLLICHWFVTFDPIDVKNTVNSSLIQCDAIIPNFLTSFLIQENEFIRTFNDRSNRKLLFTGLNRLLFNIACLEFLPSDFWILTFRAMLDNIHLKRDFRYRKRYMENNKSELKSKISPQHSNSTFIRLNILTASNKPFYHKLEEDKEFVLSFQNIFNLEQFKNRFNLSEQLNLVQQEYLSKLIKEGFN